MFQSNVFPVTFGASEKAKFCCIYNNPGLMARLIFLFGGRLSFFLDYRDQLMHGNIWCDTYCLHKGKTKTKRPTFAFKLKSNVPVWVWGAEQSMSEFIIAGNGRLAANYISKLKTILRSQWGQKRSINYPETKTLPLCIIQRKDQYTFASQTPQPILLAYQQTSKQALSHGQLFKSASKLLAL